MNYTMNHIFRHIDYSELEIKRIKRYLKNQSKLNKAVSLFVITTSIYLIITEAEIRRQNRKIKKLIKNIEDTKHVEGE